MQLDFLSRLTAWVREDTPVEREKKKPAAPREDAVLTGQARELLRGLGLESLSRRVRVIYNFRMRSTAGRANYAKALITLNPLLLDHGKNEVDLTFRHELAHLIARERAGRSIPPHGADWKLACRDLGIANEKRCHNLPLPRRHLPRKHFYHCPGCRLEISRVRPFRRRVACLDCCRKHSGGRYDDRFRLVKVAAA